MAAVEGKRLDRDFYARPCPQVAEDLVGKLLVYREDREVRRLRITETECYCGEADTACHAHKGKTKRTEVLYGRPGTVYVYLCYGVHCLLNLVTGREGEPEAVLIRACEGAAGPGKLTKALGITGKLNREDACGERLWVEDDGRRYAVVPDTRVGIGYAAPEDQERLWRFKMGGERPAPD